MYSLLCILSEVSRVICQRKQQNTSTTSSVREKSEIGINFYTRTYPVHLLPRGISTWWYTIVLQTLTKTDWESCAALLRVLECLTKHRLA